MSICYPRWTPGAEIGLPIKLYEGLVDPNWIDYNGHMTEASYLTAFGDASDALFRYVGIDEAYREAGHSFYTVETHINYYKEMSSGEPLYITTQLLGLDEKRLHLFHTMTHGLTHELVATTEQMLVHVDMKAASPISPDVYLALKTILAVHQAMPIPKQVGRQMTLKKRTD
jgi:acyl-CoA thioesterase FadM